MEKDLTKIKGFIYKITSPNGKIYIGQTLNHYKRKSHYKNNDFKGQIKLWNNCAYYKWNPSDNFEIIEECLCGYKKEYLNEREKYWILFYDSFKNGLNCNEGGDGNIGHKHSSETIKKMSNAKIGVKHSEERNKHKSEYTKGRKHTSESKVLMSKRKCENMTEDVKNRISVGLIGNKNGIGNKGNRKKIICLNNGIIYDSIKQASLELGLFSTNIVNVCKGKLKKIKGYKFKYYEEEISNF